MGAHLEQPEVNDDWFLVFGWTIYIISLRKKDLQVFRIKTIKLVVY